jgi:fructose-bisphosphate aldolase class II
MSIMSEVKPGVLVGDDVTKLFRYAQAHGFAIPSFNVTSSSVINGVFEAAAKTRSPVMVQVSNGGGIFFAGKFVDNKDQRACVAGSVAAAHHVHQLAEMYGIPVILHTDHCAKKLLPWLDGMLDENEKYFKVHGKPLFSSHMIDLSEEPLAENIAICKKYLTRMAKMGITLEMELGVTGGEEDGVDNTGVENSKLYTQPEEVYQVWKELSAISPRFTIAAAFGNVHGVYAPGNVHLRPDILGTCQKYIQEKEKLSTSKPVMFVFHGGSGSEKEKIQEGIQNGVVKMNVDTDTQWAYWEGILKFYKEKEGYLQGQIGNPEGPTKPNKKYYDPRVWLRKAEETLITRVIEAFVDLGCKGKLD